MGSALQACSYQKENSSTQNDKKLQNTVKFLYGSNYFQFSATTNSLKNLDKELLILFETEDFNFVKNPHFKHLNDQAIQLQKIVTTIRQTNKTSKEFTFRNLNADKKPIVNLKFKFITVIIVNDLKNSRELRQRAKAYFDSSYKQSKARSIVITQFPSYLNRSKDEDFNVFVDQFLRSDCDKAQYVTVATLDKQSNTFHKKLIHAIRGKYNNKQ